MKVKNLYLKILKYYISVSINDHPYSINSGNLLFFETTIKGNTADLAMVQKTIIGTLHKEDKSQRVIKVHMMGNYHFCLTSMSVIT